MAVKTLGRHRRVGPLSECVAVFGAPRSGTTWLAELVQGLTGYGALYEPLYKNKLPELAALLPPGNRPYVAPGSSVPELTSLLTGVYTGRELRAGYIRRNRREVARFLKAGPVLTKEVRAQTLLPYVAEHLPGLRIILIVRDPRAVAASKVHEEFGVWKERTRLSRSYDPLLGDHPELAPPSGMQITPHVAAALEWFVEHAYLSSFPELLGRIRVVRYEDLYDDPRQAIGAIGEWLGKPLPRRMEGALRRPSHTVMSGSALERGGDPTKAWTTKLDAADQGTIEGLFEHYDHPFGYGR